LLTSYECVQACRDWEEERTVSEDSSLSAAAGRRGPGSAAVTQQKREGRFSGNHGRGECAAGRGVGGVPPSTQAWPSRRPAVCSVADPPAAAAADLAHATSTRPCHICARTRPIPAHICTGTRLAVGPCVRSSDAALIARRLSATAVAPPTGRSASAATPDGAAINRRRCYK
jgi:hypothetical protein